jgi:formylglycine-generating enzyme required for sulfatase activity
MKERNLSIFVVLLLTLCFVVAGNAQQIGSRSAESEQADEFTNSIGMQFVLVPAGSFMKGCNKDLEKCKCDEKPQHRMSITRPFYMGKQEVTKEQWTIVMGGNPGEFKGQSSPVENVSWDDAQEFIKRLSKKEGRSYRLPTEMEWANATRSCSASAYCSGDAKKQPGQYDWSSGNSGNETHSAGQLKPYAWGLHDMHDNVWEWCQDDLYDENDYGNSPSSGKYRVARSDFWDGDAFFLRASYRCHYYGFRVVLPAL